MCIYCLWAGVESAISTAVIKYIYNRKWSVGFKSETFVERQKWSAEHEIKNLCLVQSLLPTLVPGQPVELILGCENLRLFEGIKPSSIQCRCFIGYLPLPPCWPMLATRWPRLASGHTLGNGITWIPLRTWATCQHGECVPQNWQVVNCGGKVHRFSGDRTMSGQSNLISGLLMLLQQKRGGDCQEHSHARGQSL